MTLVNADTGEVVAEHSFEENEQVIKKGLSTFVEVGTALAEIRDAGQYVGRYSSFENYCQVRWGLSRSRAYQMIDAAEMSTIVDTPLASESHARALAPLRNEPEVMAEVMAEVTAEAEADDARVTANRIAEKVAERITPTPAPRPTPAPDPAPEPGRLRHLANASRAAQAAHQLFKFDAAALAELDDPMTHETVRLLRGITDRWFESYEKARPTGLRVVNGGVK